tara:strand:- start:11667 stop:15116 length:3450 start_codon:yes stop_codon:yes gene_type:complete
VDALTELERLTAEAPDSEEVNLEFSSRELSSISARLTSLESEADKRSQFFSSEITLRAIGWVREHLVLSGYSAANPDEAEIIVRFLGSLIDLSTREPASDTILEIRFRSANVLYDLGCRARLELRETALTSAIEGHDRALEACSAQSSNLTFARVLTNRANAVKRFAEMLDPPESRAKLREVVADLEKVLTLIDPTEVPYEAITTYMNLGNTFGQIALTASGESQKEALMASLSSHDSGLALDNGDEDLASIVATTQMNRASTLSRLADITGGNAGRALLIEAVSAYETVLTVRTVDADPFGWAVTVINQANTQLRLARLLGGEEALEALEKGIRGSNRAIDLLIANERVAESAAAHLIQAVLQMELAGVLHGNESRNALDQAVSGFDKALEFYDLSTMPYYWCAATIDRSIAHMMLSDVVEHDLRHINLDKASDGFSKALEILDAATNPSIWGAAISGYATTQHRIGLLEEGSAAKSAFSNAIEGYRKVIAEAHTQEVAPGFWSADQTNLGISFESLGDVSDGKEKSDCFGAAAEAFTTASNFFRNGPSLLARLNALQSVNRVESKREGWAKSAEQGWEAIGLVPQALAEANSTRELRGRLDRSRGVSDNTAYSLVRMGKIADAVLAIEAGRVHLLRNELKMLEAKLAPNDLSELLDKRSRLAEMQTIFDSQSNSLNAASGGVQSGDQRDIYDSSQRDLQEARESFNAFALSHGLAGSKIPEQNEFHDAFQGDLGPGAAVIISVSLNGTLIFVLPNGQPTLEETHVSSLPSFDSTSLSDLLTQDEDGWFAKYALLQFELQTANRIARERPYEEALPKFAAALNRWNSYLIDVLERIWNDLMRAVDQALIDANIEEGCPISLIVPGQLSLLPLHAAGPSNGYGSECFLDRWETSYVPSLQVLASLRRRAASENRPAAKLLAITDPLGDLGADQNPAAAAFPKNAIVDLPRHEATRLAVANNIPQCNYASFYCHGVWNNEDPDESALILAQGEPLRTADLYRMRMENYRLVVLGACQSGLASVASAPDEFQGLPTAFLQAGVGAVLATHWPVVTTTIDPAVSAFFELHIGQGYTPASALRSLVQEFRASKAPAIIEGARVAVAVYEKLDEDREEAEKLSGEAANETTESMKVLTDLSQPVHWAGFSISGL